MDKLNSRSSHGNFKRANVNELSLVGEAPYETKQDEDKALTGKTRSKGGILPDDNVRIYVPMDLNADIIMWRLYALQNLLGSPT